MSVFVSLIDSIEHCVSSVHFSIWRIVNILIEALIRQYLATQTRLQYEIFKLLRF